MIPIVIIARVACIYFLIPFFNKFCKNKEKNAISWSYQAILLWGGLRGAVPVALVLAIPEDFPNRELIIQFTFAFIMFTLLFQGTTIKPLMSMLGIHPEDTGFGDREVKEVSFDFKNIGLSLLISKTLRDIFDDEAFFIRDRSTTNSASYIMKRGQIMYEMNQEKGVLTLTSEEKNIPYFKRVLFEALLMLEKSVETIKEITDPNKMNELIHDDNPETEAASFNIIKYMSDERVLMDIKSESKDGIIKELVTNLVETNAITQEQFEETLNDVLERESTMTTALGDQIAMPHARKCPFIKNITLVFGLAPNGKEFEAVDGKPVNIFVLILSPKDAAEPHVQVLVSLSKVLSKPENRSELLSSKSNIEFTNKFKRMVKESK
jgi:mannitol/fructose-specific phosphotransferase system IIA component (Ntr-type)